MWDWGTATYVSMRTSRDRWRLLGQQLALGDVLVMAVIDRLGRRYLETMWAIYDLQRRGIRLLSLADHDSPKAFMGNVLASMEAYVGQPGAAEHQPQNQGGASSRQGEGRGTGPAEASHQRAARRYQAGHGGRDARRSGGTEVH